MAGVHVIGCGSIGLLVAWHLRHVEVGHAALTCFMAMRAALGFDVPMLFGHASCAWLDAQTHAHKSAHASRSLPRCAPPSPPPLFFPPIQACTLQNTFHAHF
eukprot:352249-Chlamydomonas_euryale.AAC.5